MWDPLRNVCGKNLKSLHGLFPFEDWQEFPADVNVSAAGGRVRHALRRPSVGARGARSCRGPSAASREAARSLGMSVDVPAALTASYDKWAEIASEIDDVDPQKSREMMQQAVSGTPPSLSWTARPLHVALTVWLMRLPLCRRPWVAWAAWGA